ncbi:MAG: carboxypeptidase-like regulatory domain-containing protein [Caldilineaceae bacterium]
MQNQRHIPSLMRIGTRSALFVAMLVAMIVGGLFVGPQALRAQTNPTVVITVVDTNSSPVVGVPVYAFNGTTYTNINGATDANGQVTLSLPAGNYNSPTSPPLTANGTSTSVAAAARRQLPGDAGRHDPRLRRVHGDDARLRECDGRSARQQQRWCRTCLSTSSAAARTSTPAATPAAGQVTFGLPVGDYYFRADITPTTGGANYQYFSGGSAGTNTCTIPGCGANTVTVPRFDTVVVTVSDGGTGTISGVPVYVFSGTSYTSRNATSDTNGQATFNLPEGSYNFRADVNGVQYFSGGSAGTNSCTVLGCTADTVTASVFENVTVTVTDSNGPVADGTPVYVFSGAELHQPHRQHRRWPGDLQPAPAAATTSTPTSHPPPAAPTTNTSAAAQQGSTPASSSAAALTATPSPCRSSQP